MYFFYPMTTLSPPKKPSPLVLNLKNKSTTRIFIKPTKKKQVTPPPPPTKIVPMSHCLRRVIREVFFMTRYPQYFFLIRRSLPKVEQRIKFNLDKGNVLFLLNTK